MENRDKETYTKEKIQENLQRLISNGQAELLQINDQMSLSRFEQITANNVNLSLQVTIQLQASTSSKHTMY